MTVDIVLLEGEYKLGSDSRQWIVSESYLKKDKDGKPMKVEITLWRNVGYFATLKQVLEWLPERVLRTSNAKTLTQLSKDLETVSCALSERLTGISDTRSGGKQGYTKK